MWRDTQSHFSVDLPRDRRQNHLFTSREDGGRSSHGVTHDRDLRHQQRLPTSWENCQTSIFCVNLTHTQNGKLWQQLFQFIYRLTCPPKSKKIRATCAASILPWQLKSWLAPLSLYPTLQTSPLSPPLSPAFHFLSCLLHCYSNYA